MPVIGVPIPAGGHFTTREVVQNFAGPDNITAYLNKGGGSPTDPTVAAAIDAEFEQVLGGTDADIRLAWRYRLKETGTTFSALAPTDPDELVWLSDSASWGVTVRAYSGRGEYDAGKDIDGKMDGLRKRYEARLGMIRDGSALIASQEAAGVTDDEVATGGTFQNVPIRRSWCG